jgi:glutathione-regulated potassium-efflux system ancillary protein KefF
MPAIVSMEKLVAGTAALLQRHGSWFCGRFPMGPSRKRSMILVIYAHPYPTRSRACRALLDSIRTFPALELRSHYDLYPDYDIDVTAEQQALSRANLIVWLHPLYWYSVPALLKHWFDKVLESGFAYGIDGRALHGKQCLWVTTTGGDQLAYSSDGRHEKPFDHFIAPVEETARYCGLHWQPPIVVHGAHLIEKETLAEHGQQLLQRLQEWAASQAVGS